MDEPIIFNAVREILIEKLEKGYKININGKEIDLPDVTNFEFRLRRAVPVEHIYFGDEGRERFRVNFNKTIDIEISSPDARCKIIKL